jgi:hypothetical protein
MPASQDSPIYEFTSAKKKTRLQLDGATHRENNIAKVISKPELLCRDGVPSSIAGTSYDIGNEVAGDIVSCIQHGNTEWRVRIGLRGGKEDELAIGVEAARNVGKAGALLEKVKRVMMWRGKRSRCNVPGKQTENCFHR